MIELKQILCEIKVSKPYYVTKEGHELIKDMGSLRKMIETILSKYYNKHPQGSESRRNIGQLEAMFWETDESNMFLVLQIGFNQNVSKPITKEQFIKNIYDELGDEDGGGIFDKLIKFGYIK